MSKDEKIKALAESVNDIAEAIFKWIEVSGVGRATPGNKQALDQLREAGKRAREVRDDS